MELQEIAKLLREEAQKIRSRNSHWLSCQDGSFEAACDADGVHVLEECAEKLKNILKHRG